MPEMLQFAGQTFNVHKRADKTCDTIEWTGLRRLEDTVHLPELRCDGSAHGGCQAGCLLFWKEDWLERAEQPDRVSGSSTEAPVDGPSAALSESPLESVLTEARTTGIATAEPSNGHGTATNGHGTNGRLGDAWSGPTVEELTQAVHQPGTAADANFYTCQATELRRATSPLEFWDARQYVDDVGSGNVTLAQAATGLTIGLYNKVRRLLRLQPYPRITGRLVQTPTEHLDLQPGEIVEVKSREEIEATLDADHKNRGLHFDAEMLRFCGGQYRVLRRVERIIDEKSGKLIKLPGPCVILENGLCDGRYHRFCPRGIYHFWHEIWLRRVDTSMAGDPGS